MDPEGFLVEPVMSPWNLDPIWHKLHPVASNPHCRRCQETNLRSMLRQILFIFHLDQMPGAIIHFYDNSQCWVNWMSVKLHLSLFYTNTCVHNNENVKSWCHSWQKCTTIKMVRIEISIMSSHTKVIYLFNNKKPTFGQLWLSNLDPYSIQWRVRPVLNLALEQASSTSDPGHLL